MKTSIFIVAIAVLSLLASSARAAESPVDTTGGPVDSPGRALEVAYAYTGFKEIADLIDAEDYSNVKVIICRDSTIPFLVDQVYDKPIWQILVDDVYIDMPRCSQETESRLNPKEFYILIDSTAGFFIKAYTKYHGEHDPYLGSEPGADRAEMQLEGREFRAFSMSVPNVRMHEALGAAPMSSPLRSKELSIYLVEQNFGGTKKLLWNVFGRGFPPGRTFQGGHVLPQNNHAWTIVDAGTGQFLCSGNAPSPVR